MTIQILLESPYFNIIFFVIFIFILVIIALSSLKLKDQMSAKDNWKNINLVSEILNSNINETGALLIKKEVAGTYKGRKIVFTEEIQGASGSARLVVRLKAIPNSVGINLKEFYFFRTPEPTVHTSLKKDGISYLNLKELDKFKNSIMKREEIIEIFDHLAHACEIVETNLDYYKKGK